MPHFTLPDHLAPANETLDDMQAEELAELKEMLELGFVVVDGEVEVG